MTIEEFAKRSAQRAYLEKECRDADTISRKLFDQIKWERDLAVSQLEALGYGLGEIPKTDGDLISRRAAIDIAEKAFVRGLLATPDLRRLPSAQRWVSVSERLPEKEEKSYWVCLETGGQCQCRWTNDMYGLGGNEYSEWGWHIMDKPQYSVIVAYRPLPEPYQEERNGDSKNRMASDCK